MPSVVVEAFPEVAMESLLVIVSVTLDSVDPPVVPDCLAVADCSPSSLSASRDLLNLRALASLHEN
jgi:hypothetical protein